MTFRRIDVPTLNDDIVYPLRRRANGIYWVAGIVLLLAILAHAASTRLTTRGGYGLEFGAIGLASLAMYLLFIAYRLKGFPRFELRFGAEHLSFPSYPLWRQALTKIRYTDIAQVDMSHDNSGWWMWVTTRDARHRVPLTLLPKEIDGFEIAYCVELRVWNAKQALRMPPQTIAAIERELFLRRPLTAVVVEERDDTLHIYGVLDEADDHFTALQDDNPWGIEMLRRHKLIVLPARTIVRP
ncbi:MAG: hypothetical protein IPK60_07810 [Sandaracinaceae bacterium]|nr:hypothetical protein [Sandaracinaceae bacterium]